MQYQAIGHDWYQLTNLGKESDQYEELIKVPGVQVYRKPGVANPPIDRLSLHLSHLCLLPSPRPTGATPPTRPSRPSTFKPPFELYDYQQEAVNYISNRRGALLLHDLGLGKTIIALAAASYPAIVIAPKSAMRVWKLEAERTGLKVQLLKGRKADTSLLTNDIDLFIINYSIAPYWMGYFRKVAIGPTLKTMIADEAQMLQKKKLKWTQAFNSAHRDLTLLLSATPARNRLQSLWPLLDAVSPRAWGTQYTFRLRYCGAYQGEYGLINGEPTNIDELEKRLASVAISKNWTDPALAALRPALTRHKVHAIVGLDQKAQLLQEAAQAALSTFGDAEPQGTQLKYLTAQRASVGRLKAHWLHESGTLERCTVGTRTIWWCWHRETAQILAKALKGSEVPVDLVTGSTDSQKREDVLKEWQFGDPTEPRILIATLGAMSSAVNLVTAKAAYFLELDYAPLNIIQAEKRHHRPGNQFKEVEAHYIIIPGTIDARMSQVLLEKVSESEAVLGDAGQKDQIFTLFDKTPIATEKDALLGLAKRLTESH